MGMMGPVIGVEVGDTLEVVLKVGFDSVDDQLKWVQLMMPQAG
jgi:hypothetical protein